VPAVNRILLKWAWPTGLKKFVAQAGLTIKPGRIILLSAILAVAAYEFFDYVFQEPILSLIAGALIALLPLGIVAWKRGKRLAKFEEQLPEALDLLGRAVRAGHSFTTGLELIGKECSEPVAGEFRTTFEEQNFGLPLRDSLINLTERVPLVDVRLLVTALLIQKDTGGNLAEILDELSRVIRERFKIYRDVRVKSAQGRLTAGILIAMPLIMMALLGGVNPNYLHILFNDPAGHTMLIVAGLMQIVGSFLLWRIVNIEV
jgi:tight adherence protein B